MAGALAVATWWWRKAGFSHSAAPPLKPPPQIALRSPAGAPASGYRLTHYERDGSRFPNAVLVPAC